MIAQDFVYCRPDTKEEAVEMHQEFANPLYYGGGSEIITMCRAGDIHPDAVIDIKMIPEANVLQINGDTLAIGGCVSLRQIKDSKRFPLLGAICGRIADHTNQCRITLGGNLCGTIRYRETVMALLLTDAEIVCFGPDGQRTVSIHEAFDERMRFKRGELILQVRIPAQFLQLPFTHVKKTSAEKIDYPLISVTTLSDTGGARFAISGYLDHPFRSAEMERILNNRGENREKRANESIRCVPGNPIADYQGSAKYRQFVLKRTLIAAMEVMGI